MDKTKIQWTDATINFWQGCKKVSEGCKFCYMYRQKNMNNQDGSIVSKISEKRFYEALEWKEPRKIFTCSWSDFFIDEADDWRDEAWDVIRKTPQHTWQILTKRPERILQCLPADWGTGWDNVWLGTSIENQKNFQRAITLSKIPSKIRFISAEPLIEELNLLQMHEGRLVMDDFHWCIVGGESGNEWGKYLYRPCEKKWIEKIITDLKNTHVKVFVKQMGTYLAKEMQLTDKHGGDAEEWDNHLFVREFPSVQDAILLPNISEKLVLN